MIENEVPAQFQTHRSMHQSELDDDVFCWWLGTAVDPKVEDITGAVSKQVNLNPIAVRLSFDEDPNSFPTAFPGAHSFINANISCRYPMPLEIIAQL